MTYKDNYSVKSCRNIYVVWYRSYEGNNIVSNVTLPYSGLLRVDCIFEWIKDNIDPDIKMVISWQLSE